MTVPVTVSQLAIAPVKGMRLHGTSEIRLGQHGVTGDREFLVIEKDGKLLLTGRTPALLQIEPAWDWARDVLALRFPDGSVVLVSGAPGTMKTSLTYHILHANALDGVRGLYVSLEQSRASLVDHTEGLGYRLEDTDGNLSILDLGMLRKKLTGPTQQPWMDLFKLYTQGIRKSFDYRLLVLDSLDALEILAKFREPRRDMFSLIHWLRDLHCTAFLLGELPTDSGSNGSARTAYARHKEEYLADGILHLRLARQGEFGMQRQLRVVKMRGTRHETGYHALVFDNGLRVTRILA